MNTNQKFNGNRLKEAVQYRGQRLSDIANQTGISRQSLSLYANGENQPPYENVVAIAKTLNFPYAFFLTEDKCATVTGNTYFRSQASATKLLQNAQKIKLEYVAKIYKVFLDYVYFPALSLPLIKFESEASLIDTDSEETLRKIEKIAEETRKQWNLGSGPIDNLQFLLESKGLIVTGFKETDSRIDAFSQQIHVKDGEQVFIIALALGEKPMERLRFDMAHELGHILMHAWGESNEDIDKDEFSVREKQANMFASAFLLPRETFGRAVAPYATNLEFYRTLKKQWGVSMQAMMYRARQLDIISANQFQYMMRQVSKRGWRTKEPGDKKGMLENTIFQGAIDILIDEGYLNVNTLLEAFNDYGIVLKENDLEDLMCLKEGTLRTREDKVMLFRVKDRMNPENV